MSIITFHNYINGELCTPNNNSYLNNINPATGKVFAKIPNSDKNDVEKAVVAAEKAFPIWSKMSVNKRSKIMMRLALLIDENLEKLALAESMDNGKPLWLAKQVDIPRASSNFSFFAHAITQFASEAHAMTDAINYTLRQPIGIVGCISPWNLPLYLFSWKIAPALATGNCVIAKPSEVTPYTAFLLSELCMEAGFPAGVLNILHGLGQNVGQAIVEHPKIKAISFTGGTNTGKKLAATAAPMFKKLSLELGGKNPALIFADCDFDKMLNETVRSAFANQGQICLCTSRIYVERGIYDKFKNAFVQKVAKMRVGDPLQDESKVGAVVSESHRDKILYHINLAKEEGGKILTGGKKANISGRCVDGFFIEPTVIEGLNNTCKTNQEEIFGPVATIQPFDTEEEAIQLANENEYGLASTVWTTNINKANRVAQNIESGIVWVNCWLHRDLRTPFGGVKNSGVGREGGYEALRFFTEPKNVCVMYGGGGL